MRVTERQMPMEKKLKEKLDLHIKRCTQKQPKLDTAIVIDGYEGHGKTTMALGIAFYVSQMTGRQFSHKNIFFDIKRLIKFAQNTKEQIIIWDEAALGGLSSQWWNKSMINLTKLLMTCRKLRHFFIFNIPKIFKLNEYLADDRTLGLIHCKAKNETQVGYFIYFKRSRKSILYDRYKRARKKSYMNYSFRGTFPDVLNPKRDYNILDVFDINDYENRKDEAIKAIGKSDDGLSQKELRLYKLKYLISQLPFKQKQIAEWFDIKQPSLSDWSKLPKKYPEILEL